MTVAADEIDVEASRIEARAGQLKFAYRQLATFSGALGGSREKMYRAEVDKKADAARELASKAASAASNGTRKQISSRETEVAGYLTKIRALREDLEHEHAGIDAQVLLHRQSRTGREGG